MLNKVVKANVWKFLLCLYGTLCAQLINGYHLMERHEKVSYLQPGDLMLGGIFTLHWTDSETHNCSLTRPLREIFRVEAMAYAIEVINKNDDILPGITLGFQILDDCGTEQSSLAAVLHFVPGDVHRIEESDCECPELQQRENIVGIIGPPLSANAIPTSKLLNLFHLPQISHAATSDALSDKATHPYFLRTVPPEGQRAKAIVELLLHFNWTYVFTINSAEHYGRNAIDKFIDASKDDICIAGRFELSSDDSANFVDRLVEIMMENTLATVVVLFSLTRELDMLFAGIERANADKLFTFITTEREALDVGQGGHGGMIAGGLFVGSVKTEVGGLKEHFTYLTPENHMDNPWFQEYYDQYLNCTIIDVSCNASFHVQESKTYASPVADAVYAFASALDGMRRDLCPGTNDRCESLIEGARNGDRLLTYLFRDQFEGCSGMMNFDSHGDIMAKYPLFVLQFVNDRYELLNVGRVDTNNKKVLIDTPIHWNSGDTPPISSCGQSCSPRQVPNYRQDGCCWECWTCFINEIVNANGTGCERCEIGFWPSDSTNTCERIPATYIQWADGIAIGLLCFAASGVVVVFAVVTFYINHRRHPVIKAASRELSTILLFGIVISFSMVVTFIAEPTPVTCFINRLGFTLCFAIIYAPILARANRIYRIFSAAKKSAKPPRLISPCSQITISLLLISIEVVISTVWVIVLPPEPVEVMPVLTEKKIELSCNITEAEVITSVTYNLLLLIFCCFYAFKTRKVPDNYNESRHIGWTVYTVLVIWLAFIPTYFVIKDAILKVCILSMTVIINAWVNLVFMFWPKIFDVKRTQNLPT
ncbi:metabotropic glutamate receptor 3-like [Ptychodera flava]|uniref:metabotropic glutamate receptor 3-like n=1 Tax=Ptychodera flava TaxID=63121 RepID=UPI00396A30BB